MFAAHRAGKCQNVARRHREACGESAGMAAARSRFPNRGRAISCAANERRETARAGDGEPKPLSSAGGSRHLACRRPTGGRPTVRDDIGMARGSWGASARTPTLRLGKARKASAHRNYQNGSSRPIVSSGWGRVYVFQMQEPEMSEQSARSMACEAVSREAGGRGG